MEQERAERVVKQLRARQVMAHVERVGVYQCGIRVVLPDGRYAVWDADGASGLEATVMRDGVLVGFVPTIPGSEAYDEAATIDAIAGAEYGPGR